MAAEKETSLNKFWEIAMEFASRQDTTERRTPEKQTLWFQDGEMIEMPSFYMLRWPMSFPDKYDGLSEHPCVFLYHCRLSTAYVCHTAP